MQMPHIFVLTLAGAEDRRYLIGRYMKRDDVHDTVIHSLWNKNVEEIKLASKSS